MVTLGSHAYVDRLVLGEQTRSTLEYDHFKFGEDLNKMTMRSVGSSLHIEFTQFVRMVSLAVNSTNRQVELTFADPHGLTAGDTITLGPFDAATTDAVIGAPTSEIVGSQVIAIPGTNPNTTLTFNITTARCKPDHDTHRKSATIGTHRSPCANQHSRCQYACPKKHLEFHLSVHEHRKVLICGLKKNAAPHSISGFNFFGGGALVVGCHRLPSGRAF